MFVSITFKLFFIMKDYMRFFSYIRLFSYIRFFSKGERGLNGKRTETKHC